MQHTDLYQHIDRRSLLYTHYVFLDTEAYLADQLFLKHQVLVHFREEYGRDDSPYRVIFCHVRKRDEERFLSALEELPDKMMLLGYTDYLDTCKALWCNQHRDNVEEVDGHDAIDPTGQAQ